MKIAVVGSGYVGLVAAVGFCELGHSVICVDNDIAKVRQLQQGLVPIHEEFLPELLQKHSGTALSYSSDLHAAVRASEVIFIAVGTPQSESGEADLSYVEAVSREVASAINSYKVIVEKSTVPAYTSKWIRRSMLLNGAPPELFDVVSNPEFLREGSALMDFLYPDRIVIGGDNERSARLVQQIYEPLLDGSYYKNSHELPTPVQFPGRVRLITTSTTSAELIKHASNAFLAMKISFINAVANVCEELDADIQEVAEGIGSDQRIGPHFLKPGIGYGGSCFPKDLKAFHKVAQRAGCAFELLQEVESINQEQHRRFLRKVRNALWTLKGKRVAALGLSFKGGTDDIRESPAIAIIEELLKEGCEVVAYDPAAMARAHEYLPASKQLFFAKDPYSAIESASAVLVLTEWDEFARLDLRRVKSLLKYPVMIDGRNLYRPQEVAEAGLVYVSIGRADVFPHDHPATKELAGTNGNGHAVSINAEAIQRSAGAE